MKTQLKCAEARLVVDATDGGRWTSLRIADLEVLGKAAIPGAYPPTLSGCFPMAPYAGRVRDAVLEFRGGTYQLPRTAPPHAIHGTSFDVPWRIDEAGDSSIRMSVDLGPQWPFRGRVEQRISLRADAVDAELALEAIDAMPAVLGFHPWFRRRLARGEAAVLDLDAGGMYLRGADGLPTGEVSSPPPGPWDDCFFDLRDSPVIRWPGALELTVTSPAPAWVVFDERPEAICVEPQTAPPDAFRMGLAAALHAGERLSLPMQLGWR